MNAALKIVIFLVFGTEFKGVNDFDTIGKEIIWTMLRGISVWLKCTDQKPFRLWIQSNLLC